MDKSPLSLKHKRLEWDGRTVQDGILKQELPQPPRLKTMNGAAIKSTFQHLGTQVRKAPLSILRPQRDSALSSPASVSTREKNHYQEFKSAGSSGRFSHIRTNDLQCEIDGVPLTLTASSNLSLLTPTSCKASDKIDVRNSYDSKYNSKSSDDDDQSTGENFSPLVAVPRGRLSSLQIDISASIQSIDNDEFEMRRQLYDLADSGLSNPKHSGRETNLFRDNLNGSDPSLPKPLCRLEVIGRGSSAIIYKAILLKSLSLCAEKVIVVADSSKRIQMMSELESLKKTVRDRNGRSRCENIISLLDIVSNPKDGTISICLEYMNGT